MPDFSLTDIIVLVSIVIMAVMVVMFIKKMVKILLTLLLTLIVIVVGIVCAERFGYLPEGCTAKLNPLNCELFRGR